MSIQNTLLAVCCLLFASGDALADNARAMIGDIYLISRDESRTFRGSHQIYSRKSEGLVEVYYCGRPYWVRYATVAWTQLEVARDFDVRIEQNWGKGWRPICDRPTDQVTLNDLGILEEANTIVRNNGAAIERVNRFTAIRDSFRAESGDVQTESFHSK